MRPGLSIISVSTGDAGWEVRRADDVLYWGPGMHRALAEAERFAELFAPAVVVVDGDGPGPRERYDLPNWGFG